MKKVPKVILIIEDSRAHGRALLQGISRYAKYHGPWTFYRDVCNPSYGHGIHLREGAFSHFARLNADGLITRNPGKTQAITDKGVPTIIAITEKDIPPQMPYLSIDHDAVGKMAAEYFLEKGYRNFAFCGYPNMYWSKLREEGFVKTIDQAGYRVWTYQDASSRKLKQLGLDSPIEHLAQWIETLPRPTALMACNDNRAANVMEATKIAEIDVPEELAVLGVDNDLLICNMCNPPLSSIQLNTEHGGYEAAELLDRLMQGEKMHGQRILVKPVQIISRESTDILAVEDEDVANALRYMRENRQLPIQVSDVVDSVLTSRRYLQKKFRALLNHTILEEIKRVRIDYAKQLLLDTNMTVSEIALKMNFPGVNSFSRYFSKETGMSPLEFKRELGKY